MQQTIKKAVATGMFYEKLCKKNSYEVATQACIKSTVENLLNMNTTQRNPGMLLGKIQSGKTRTFLGIMGLAFDNGYDISIVLTKGTKALAYQTYARIKEEFSIFVEDEQMKIFDIMSMPENLRRFELKQKIVIIAKKQKDNLRRLHNMFTDLYPGLRNKRTLIIDDEADYASIGFTKGENEVFEVNTIAGQIDALRQMIVQSDFLQVTATPYSLYLQPENEIVLSGYEFRPIKPAFTELAPHGTNYIGGEYYFQESQDDSSIAFYLHKPISDRELIILKKPDERRFKLKNALSSNGIESLRGAIINFLVGGVIRRMQNERQALPKSKYSFIIHTEQQKNSHRWQKEIVEEIIKQLTKVMEEEPLYFSGLITDAYIGLSRSLSILNIDVPSVKDVIYHTKEALEDEYILVSKVNSQTDINELLDEDGQLDLRVPFNIFIGGQILDRGVTINNLIGFYYGRNPQVYQQDTVLQHSRMYGYRDRKDLAVTRFYTTPKIYEVMRKMNDFDQALREAIKKQDLQQVVFIERDTENKIIPCNPNKLVLSKITSLQPYKRLLPVGIQTYAKTRIQKLINQIDMKIDSLVKENGERLVTLEDAIELIEMIHQTFDPNQGEEWDVNSYLASLEFLSKQSPQEEKVWLIVRRNRNISRIRESSQRYEDAPDTPRGENSELKVARNLAKEVPALILLRENGKQEKGWRDSPFWWPVLVTPASTPPVIFANETIDM